MDIFQQENLWAVISKLFVYLDSFKSCSFHVDTDTQNTQSLKPTSQVLSGEENVQTKVIEDHFYSKTHH